VLQSAFLIMYIFPFHKTTLIDYSVFCSSNGNDIVSSFGDDKDGDSSVLDCIVFCLWYDDIVHKEDSIGYRIFLMPGFYVSFCNRTIPSLSYIC
jgi:hypothetical protein